MVIESFGATLVGDEMSFLLSISYDALNGFINIIYVSYRHLLVIYLTDFVRQCPSFLSFL